MKFKVYFNVRNLDGSLYELLVPNLRTAMENELIRCYNIYADKANSGITNELNAEFKRLYPNYLMNNKGKEWYELSTYNLFMAEGYQRLIVDEMNNSNVSPLLNFRVEPEEVVFTGYLKVDENITIDFYMKEV